MKLAILLLLLMFPAAAFAQEADLAIDASPQYTLDGLHLSATVTNDGPDEVLDTDVVIQFDTAAITASNLEEGCTGSSVGVVCSFSQLDTPVLAVGGEFTIELDLMVQGDAGSIEVSVSSTVDDPDESNNTDTVLANAPTTADVSIDERGIDAGTRQTLIFEAANHGPDEATRVRASGTVTVDFGDEVDGSAAEARTGMTSDDGVICGRQVPASSGTLRRWTFPITCSLSDLDSGDGAEFHFWFEGGNNALFRLTIDSDSLDTNRANNTTDGDFLNSPIEVVEVEEAAGCCTTVRPGGSGAALLVACAAALGWRRRRFGL